jgi:hypothetical protein
MRRPGASHLVASTLAALLLATSCGGGDDDDADDTGHDQAASADSTTSSSVGPSTTLAPGDWEGALNNIQERIFDLMADPDPERLTDVVHEECDCWEYYSNTVEALHGAGTHWETEGERGVSFLDVRDTYADGASVVVRWNLPTIREIDERGDVVKETPGGLAAVCTSAIIGPGGPDGTYRLESEVQLEGCPEEAG